MFFLFQSYLQDYFGQGLLICINNHYYNHAREILNSSLTFLDIQTVFVNALMHTCKKILFKLIDKYEGTIYFNKKKLKSICSITREAQRKTSDIKAL